MPQPVITSFKRFGTVLSLVLSLAACHDDSPTADILMGESGLLKEVLAIVHENYAHPIKNERVVQGALNGALQSLDEFSAYFSAKDFKTLMEILDGKFGGIGAEIKAIPEGFEVIAPVEEGPAFKAGIQRGDLITAVGGEKITGMTAIEALQKIHGEPGTFVTLTILRKGSETLELKIKREPITNYPIKSSLDDRIAYIRLSHFNSQSADNLKKVNEELRKNLKEHNGKDITLQGIVLDLRDNPGGTLDQAILVTSLFLDKGTIVKVLGREHSDQQTFNSSGPDIFKDIPIVVLINKGSASAAEVLAGALRDHKRAILMGEKSYGKGSVQRIFDLKDKGAVKLTVAYFNTPNGHPINGKGLEPDIKVEQPRQVMDKSADKTSSEKTDVQKQRAIDLLRGLSALNRW